MTAGEIDTSNDALVRKEKRKPRKHSEKTKEVITPDDEVKPQENSDKRIKTKHRRKEAKTVAVAAEEMEEQATLEVNERKKHHRHKSSAVSKPDIAHAEASRPTSEDTQDAEPIDESKKKRKDKRKNADALGEASNEAGGADGNSKAKRKHKRKEKTDTGDEDVTEASAEKEKKERKKDRVSDEMAQAESSKDTTHETHEKKKRKHSRSGFPNPGDDDEISDQSKKGLVYAYVYAEDQPSWKFNKARQNWLVRNIWSDTAIPEKYFPLVKNYLSAIQGGAKETFVKTCQTFVQSAKTQNESQAGDNKTTQSTDVDGATPATAIPSAFDCKRHRAVELLHVLATSVAL